MQSDDVIWSIINNQFCSYKVKTVTQNFCRNEYNVSGFCSKSTCPLANSRYATVREEGGVVYLCMKTAERAHTPKNMWNKIPLSRDYAKALQQIDSELLYWPAFLKHKCKQRLTKITQYLIKIRKMHKETETTHLVGVKPKLERRERQREAKALSAARLEKNLEKELLSRLRSRAYGEQPLNVNEDVWQRVLEGEKMKSEAEVDEDGLERESDEDGMSDDDEDLESDEEGLEGEFIDEESEHESLQDFEDETSLNVPQKNGRKRPRRDRELEIEYEPPQLPKELSW